MVYNADSPPVSFSMLPFAPPTEADPRFHVRRPASLANQPTSFPLSPVMGRMTLTPSTCSVVGATSRGRAYPPPIAVWEMISEAARVALSPVRRMVGFVGHVAEREIARRVRRDERREEVMAGCEGVGRLESKLWYAEVFDEPEGRMLVCRTTQEQG